MMSKKAFMEDYISEYLEEQGLAYEDLTSEEIEELKAEATEAYNDMLDSDNGSEESETWEGEEEWSADEEEPDED